MNRFDRHEWAGAFGDLGTLVPFVAAYIGVVGMDPFGVLLAFGAAMVAAGFHYKTPIPVQPMKAIGAAAAAQAAQQAVITPQAVHAAALVTGLLWLAIAALGLARRVAALLPAAVVSGIVLGLGLGFIVEGAKTMHGDWVVACICGAGALLLMRQRRVPAMLVLLAAGAAVSFMRAPGLWAELSAVRPALRAPAFAWAGIDWNALFIGAILLALPQVPLTLGNAVVAIRDENNRLFPDRPVSERGIALSTGVMNVLGSAVGGVPMCHGAGGMAGHVAFGARTGGATVIVGVLLLVLALLFSGQVATLFKLFPPGVLGVILAIAGAQLALGAGKLGESRGERAVVFATAVLCMWNVALGAVVGMGLHQLRVRASRAGTQGGDKPG